MRLVYVFDMDDPDESRYLYRAPQCVAWLICRVNRQMDYALRWFA
ncbi:hypothetical protein ACWC0A_30445 [Streptomyces scopuliridis]